MLFYAIFNSVNEFEDVLMGCQGDANEMSEVYRLRRHIDLGGIGPRRGGFGQPWCHWPLGYVFYAYPDYTYSRTRCVFAVTTEH